MKILAISGSLRAASSNTSLLCAAAALAPEGIKIVIYEGIGDLPHFNPDLDGDAALPSVADFRAQLRAADGGLICSPEYAHGVPGVLKNALDWIVSSGEFMDKPVALINASHNSTHAHASLTETLKVMMANVVAEASIRIALPSNKIDEKSIVADPALFLALRSAVITLARVIEEEIAEPKTAGRIDKKQEV